VIEHILARDKADKILLGGIPAKLFLAATNPKLSLQEGGLETHQGYLSRAAKLVKAYRDRIVLPVDLAFEEHGKRIDHAIDSMPKTPSQDIGRKTVEKYSKIIEGAATTVANGPLGVFETNEFDLGTKTVLESMTKSRGYTVIGGGHLVGLATIHGIEDQFTHVSTAGGAMLSLLAGQNLPGVDALVRAATRTPHQSKTPN
jgi:phosphoglycerate kinase